MTDKPDPKTSRSAGNGPMTSEDMIAAFGPHPHAAWKYVPSKGKGRKWMKPPKE